jgi:hypothetical protein
MSRPLASIEAEQLTEYFFWENHVSKHRPIIIKNAAGSWPALSKWRDLNYLENRCGNERVGFSRMFNPLPAEPYFESVIKFKNLSECIADMRATSAGETFSIPATPVPAGWENDLGEFSFLSNNFDGKPMLYAKRRLFIYKNASTEWHYHPADETLTVQLLGAKRVSLFRLNKSNFHSYSRCIESNLHHLPQGNQLFPPDNNFIKYEGIILPGDAIYIPPFWWHGIDPADNEVGCTLAHCFRSPIKRFGSWHEPITRKLLFATLPKNALLFPPLLALLAVSTLRRKMANEKWQ